MTPTHPRPLSVGSTLDVAFKICIARFVPLAKAVFFVVAPLALVTSVVELWVLPEGLLDGSGSGETAKLTLDELRSALGGLALIGLLGAIGNLLAGAACFRIVVGACLGHEIDWIESLRLAVVRLPSILWIALLGGAAIALGLVLCVAPGLWLAVLFSLAVPVLLTERLRGRRALGRSRALVRGRFWRVALVLLVGNVLAGVIALALGSVGSAADSSTSVGFVVSWAGQAAGSTIATPIVAAVTAVVYLELRVRKEGLTFDELARELGVAAPIGGSWPLGLPDEPPEAPAAAEDAPPYWPPPPGWKPSRPPDELGSTEPAADEAESPDERES